MQWLAMGCAPSQVRVMCRGAVCSACYHLGLKAALGRPTGHPLVFSVLQPMQSMACDTLGHNNAGGMPVD